jgi:hypothetical protein
MRGVKGRLPRPASNYSNPGQKSKEVSILVSFAAPVASISIFFWYISTGGG